MSISRRGLLAAGLAVAAVGTMGVVSTMNAGAAETPTAEALTAPAVAPLESADGTVTPPTARLPWGATPRKMRTLKPGATSAALKAAGADAALDTSSRELVPEFGPKGHTVNGQPVRTGRAMPPAPPAVNAEPAPGSKKVNYFYAGTEQTVDIDGAAAKMTIGKPKVAPEDWHSLDEIAVQSADQQQIVEVGWTVDRQTNGDSDPHLFVYHWVNGKDTCYNDCGFVPAKGASILPGATLPSGVAKDFGIQHIGSYWWIAYNSEWIGAFPDTEWNGQYTRAGLVQFFGEVAASSTTPCTEMGTGIAPGVTGAARMYNITLVNGSANLSLEEYHTSGATYDSKSSSATSIRYGGPGATGC